MDLLAKFYKQCIRCNKAHSEEEEEERYSRGPFYFRDSSENRADYEDEDD